MDDAPQKTHFTEPTTEYWQEILPPSPTPSLSTSPYQFSYPAILPDSRILLLPIRPLPNNPNEAVASLLVNQASLSVVEELGTFLAAAIKHLEPDVIVGLPTLGLSVASVVAKALGHKRYVPLGYSRKFWYTDTLSTTLSSITSPDHAKKVFLDPNQLALIRGKRIVIVDDAVSSGVTLKASWDFLEGESVGAEVLAAGLVMVQGGRWKGVIGEARDVVGVFESPLLRAVGGGWAVRE